jgi:hypothetical protein
MKRVFKYILYIILIIAIILVVSWLRMRRTAQQNGTQTPTFRQFLGLGTSTPSENTSGPGTEFTSDFTDTTTDTTGTSSGSSESVATSQFTSGPLSPTQDTSLNSGGSVRNPNTNLPGIGNPPGSSTTQNPQPSTPTINPSTLPTPPLSQCTDADLTIAFTAEEISRLNALQNRFYSIAGILHTDADVQNEAANYTEFKAKTHQITELYSYCAGKSPSITAPLYSSRVSTPYWREAIKDGIGYISRRHAGWEWIQLDSKKWDPRDVAQSQAVIEQIFKLNLW